MLKPKTVLVTREEIRQKVKEMARSIEAAHQGDELVLVGVLKGGIVLMADLMRELALPVTLDFIAAESYGASTETSGVVKITRDVASDFRGRHVLLVEDIVDTGLTLRYLINHLKGKNPASLEVAVLLDKVGRRRIPVEVAYRGLEIPDAFVVGYGLDYAEHYRNLPDVMIVEEDGS